MSYIPPQGFGGGAGAGGITKLSELTIDVDKDWLGYIIKNLGAPVDPTDSARFQDIRRGETIYVAPGNSKNKDQADYVCDGTADEAEISTALDDLPTSGGVVKLLDGDLYFSEKLTILRGNFIIEGVPGATRIHLDTDYPFQIGDGVTALQNIGFVNLIFDNTVSGIWFYGGSEYRIENVIIDKCRFLNTGNYGLRLYYVDQFRISNVYAVDVYNFIYPERAFNGIICNSFIDVISTSYSAIYGGDLFNTTITQNRIRHAIYTLYNVDLRKCVIAFNWMNVNGIIYDIFREVSDTVIACNVYSNYSSVTTSSINLDKTTTYRNIIALNTIYGGNGVAFGGNYNIVLGNVILNSNEYSIYEKSDSDYNLILGNITDGDIVLNGEHTVFSPISIF